MPDEKIVGLLKLLKVLQFSLQLLICWLVRASFVLRSSVHGRWLAAILDRLAIAVALEKGLASCRDFLVLVIHA